MIIINIGSYIKKVRKEKKITSRKLAELSNVSQAYISQLETGKHINPSPDVLERIAKALGIPYIDLMAQAGYIDEKQIESLFEEKNKIIINEYQERSKMKKLIEQRQSLIESNSDASVVKKIDDMIKNFMIESVSRTEKYDALNLELSQMVIESLLDNDGNIKLEKLFNGPLSISLNEKILSQDEKTKVLAILNSVFS